LIIQEVIQSSMAENTILAIETSCDETSVAVLRDGVVLSNIIYSQLDLHAQYGGVVPNIAKVAHQQKLPGILEQALAEAKVSKAELDVVAVTYGPGLAIALEVGVNQAKSLALELNIPMLPVNHMEGHLLSSFTRLSEADSSHEMEFPALGMLVSGNHTEFIIVRGVGEYEKIGETLDDACGEAFDKASVMLGLGYPGGPKISQLAKQSSLEISLVRRQKTLYAVGTNQKGEAAFELPIPMANSQDLNMSYSGLKTAVKQIVNNLSHESVKQNIRQTGENVELSEGQTQDIAKMFEFAAIEILIRKLSFALDQHPEIRQVWTGGGVVANTYLQERLIKLAQDRTIQVRIPDKSLFGDNAAMIANVAYWRLVKGKAILLRGAEVNGVDRNPNLDF
jgi:N6-L-threonylcarbamoyladenine synthase